MTDIDAMITEAFKAPETAQPAEVTASEESQVEESNIEAEGETQEAEKEGSKTEDNFPKKAVNALSRRDKQIGKLRAEKQQQAEEARVLKEKLAKYEATGTKTDNESKKPNPDDFKTWGEYLDARDEYSQKLAEEKAEKKYLDTQKQQAEEKSKAAKEAWLGEREQVLNENQTKARKSFADFETVAIDYLTGAEISDQVKDAFLEVENGAYTLYALAKEGISIEDLNEMSNYKLAQTFAQMEMKGLSLAKPKQATNAPAPLTSLRGAGNAGKSWDRMSPEEIVAWVKS